MDLLLYGTLLYRLLIAQRVPMPMTWRHGRPMQPRSPEPGPIAAWAGPGSWDRSRRGWSQAHGFHGSPPRVAPQGNRQGNIIAL